MEFCDNCGIMLSGMGSILGNTGRIRSMQALHQTRCFCRTDLDGLEDLLQRCRRGLDDMMEEILPGVATNKRTVDRILDELPNDNPIRTEMQQRFAYITRLREEILKRKKAIQKLQASEGEGEEDFNLDDFLDHEKGSDGGLGSFLRSRSNRRIK